MSDELRLIGTFNQAISTPVIRDGLLEKYTNFHVTIFSNLIIFIL